MRTPSKSFVESTGAPSTGTVSHGLPVPATHGAPAAAAPAAASTVSRRSIVALLAAALAPAAGTAVLMPKVVETAALVLAPEMPAMMVAPVAVAERPELLALGAEVGPKLDAYRTAATALVEARAKALDLWPSIPEAIVVTKNRQRGFFDGCFDLERDLDGKVVWPQQVMVAGTLRLSRRPTEVLQAGPLRSLLHELRDDPENDPELDADLTELLGLVEQYEAACDRAKAVLAEASHRCGDAARALSGLAWKIRDLAPRTIAGVMVHARVLAAYSEAEAHAGGVAGQGHAGVILGRGLADAVLRVAGITA